MSVVSVPLLDSPDLVFDKPQASRHRAVFKSLPALGKGENYIKLIFKKLCSGHDNDPLDEELQQLSDSLGMLYEQV